MYRWLILCLAGLPAALLACSGDDDGSSAALVLDHLSARESAYHSAVGTLPGMDAIRSETSAYAGDMHGLLDEMNGECRDMEHCCSAMGGYTMEDMIGVMDRMQDLIDAHHARMDAMNTLDEMRAECESHHRAMQELLGEMSGMIPGGGMMGHRRGM